MKNLIIEEITRIHEMMGIPTKKSKLLLLEGPLGRSTMKQTAEDILQGAETRFLQPEIRQSLEDMSYRYGRKSDGSYLSVPDYIKMGRKELGNEFADEAEALVAFYKAFDKQSLDNLQSVFTSARIRQAERAAEQEVLSAKGRAKAALEEFQNNMSTLNTRLKAGEISVAEAQGLLRIAGNTIESSTGKAGEALKNKVLPIIRKAESEIDDSVAESVEVGNKDAASAAEEFERMVQKELDDANAAQRLAREEEERLARAAREQEAAQRRAIEKEFDDIIDSLKGARGRMSLAGLGTLPTWMSPYKRQIIKKLEDLKADFMAGRVTKDQLEETAENEIKKQVKKATDDLDNASSINRAKAEKRKVFWEGFYARFNRGKWWKITLIIVVLTSIFGVGWMVNFVADRNDEVSEVLQSRKLKECFAGQLDTLTNDQLTKFIKLGFTCEGNRNRIASPQTYVSTVAFVGKGKDNPDMFVVDIGNPPVKKYYDAETGVELPTPGSTPSITPTQTTTVDQATLETAAKAHLSELASQNSVWSGATFVSVKADSDPNLKDVYLITIDKDGTKMDLQRKWNGTKFEKI